VHKKESSKSRIQSQINELKDKIIFKEQKYEKISKDLAETSAFLDERRRYLEEQESVINSTVQSGNDKLLDLNEEISVLNKHIGDLKVQTIELDKSYEDMVIQYDDTQATFQGVINDLEIRKTNLEKEIDEQNQRIAEIASEYKIVSKEIENKMAILKEKETSIITKRDAMRLERQDLETEKRRWETTKGLYDL